MRQNFLTAFCLILAVSASAPVFAQAANPEDEPIDDISPPAVPTTPTAPTTPTVPVTPAAPTTPAQATSPTQTAPSQITPSAGATDTVPRAEFEALKAQQAETQRQLEELRALLKQGIGAPPATTPALIETPALDVPEVESPETPATSKPTGGGRSLLLPDFSLNVTAKGRYSSDNRDEDRRKLGLTEAELTIQGDVYPNVRAEAFIVAEPVEDVPFGVEQAFLDFLSVRKGLNIRVGRDFTPFGRTGRQHPHSWLYARQLLPRRNLVAGEALAGDGVSFSYLLPTKGKLYANATFGIYNGLGGGEISSNPFGDDLPIGTGAGYNDRFYLGRMLVAHPVGRDGELELGSSYARGRSILDDDAGANLGAGRVDLLGFDVSYRKFLEDNKRLLLRAEYFRSTPSGGLPTRRADGYYGLANLRLSKFADVGLLYENSGFPQAPNARENALSLIYTKQFTEQFYVRLQGTRGRRPGEGGYNEATVQFTWGVGPHSHNLE